jgi:hypothetical protein
LADHAPVCFDLSLTGAAEETETAPLPFKMGPAAYQSALLVIQMGQLNLKAAFRGGRSLTKNLKDQSGSIYDLTLETFLKIALLDWAKGTVDDNQFCFVKFAISRNFLNLS